MKLLRHVLEKPLPVEIARLVVLNCVIKFSRFWGEGKRESLGSFGRLCACTSCSMMKETSPSVGSRGAVVSAALSERKVAGSIPTIGDFHTVGPCKKAVFACLATDVK